MIIRLRPQGPWRFGPQSGARDRVDTICHSDTLYSAVSSAMRNLGFLEEWLEATARAGEAAVQLSSLFPWQGRVYYVIPPRSLWPPTASTKVRWKGARFVPVQVVEGLLSGQAPAEDRWVVDPVCECLVGTDRAGAGGPFRINLRTHAAVDRVNHSAADLHSTACIEFSENSGMWGLVTFLNDAGRAAWVLRIKAAFRLLADMGIGGERALGWGRSCAPEFVEGRLPGLLLPRLHANASATLSKAAPVEELHSEQEAQTFAPVTESFETLVRNGEEPEAIGSLSSNEPEVDETTSPWAADPEHVAEETAAPEGVVPESQAQETASQENGAWDQDRGTMESSRPEVETPEPGTEPVADFEMEPLPPDYASQEPGKLPEPEAAPTEAYWMLSLFNPSSSDTVDWQRGNYAIVTRGGRIESPGAWGTLKQVNRMVEEGSVLIASSIPRGVAHNTAPEGFPHPVYRSGFAVAIPVPLRGQL